MYGHDAPMPCDVDLLMSRRRQSSAENHPVTEMTWAGAFAYCNWRGARLPTEVEWEAAARGLQGRTFPWGEAMPTTDLAVINRQSGDIVPVGSRPKGATPEGLLDMAGSLL